MTQPLVRSLAPLLLLLLFGCDQSHRACPLYKAFDGIYLDYREIGLPATAGDRICLDDDCRALRDWEDSGGSGQGVVNLALSKEQPSVRLRIDLRGDRSGALRIDERVKLLPIYNADRECGVYGYSRAVRVGGQGQVDVGGATPDR
jgi:hypothetical protein